MHKCNENMNAMLVLKNLKHKNVFFKKFFDFSDFSKVWKSGMLQILMVEGYVDMNCS